jgi:pimeloyl-ACP methyl ester carboxylesterase
VTTRTLVHGRVELALRRLRAGSSPVRPLLLLHELGSRSPEKPPPEVGGWPGEIWGLDFTGHGASTVPAGGGYTAEILMADADVALASLGEVTVAGWGLGAYIGLLIAGARAASVKGAVLGDGRGLEGGGPQGGTMLTRPAFDAGGAAPDPFALQELANDARPPKYAELFARQAVQLSGVADPIVVAAKDRPPWLAGLLHYPGVVESTVRAALHRFAHA